VDLASAEPVASGALFLLDLTVNAVFSLVPRIQIKSLMNGKKDDTHDRCQTDANRQAGEEFTTEHRVAITFFRKSQNNGAASGERRNTRGKTADRQAGGLRKISSVS
jgi:hypothetical protein